jgi:hypothetical protein
MTTYITRKQLEEVFYDAIHHAVNFEWFGNSDKIELTSENLVGICSCNYWAWEKLGLLIEDPIAREEYKKNNKVGHLVIISANNFIRLYVPKKLSKVDKIVESCLK